MMRVCSLKDKNIFNVWSLLTNQMFVKYKGVWSVFQLPSCSYLCVSNKYLSDSFFRSSIIVFSKKKHKYFYMSSLFKSFYLLHKLCFNESTLKTGFYIMLDLVGLGFRINKITERLFYFELGWASGVYFLVPQHLRLSVSTKKRKIAIFSCDFHYVTNMLASFLHLRKMSPYRIGGFMQNKMIVRLRTGKQR